MSTKLFDDDYDPLAPQVAVGEPPAPDTMTDEIPAADDVPSAHEEPVPDEELGEVGDGGFGGGDGIVRVWFDDAGRLCKVRVSPVWFQRLAPGRTLAQAFHQAFRVSSLALGEAPEREQVDYSALEFGELPPFTRETMNAYLGMMEQHKRRWDEAIARAESAPRPTRRPASGKSAGVVVTLDDFGRPASVQFDEDWLDEAQVGAICTHVVTAAQRARERYVPVPDEHRTELERFRTEHDVLTAGFHALLNQKERR